MRAIQAALILSFVAAPAFAATAVFTDLLSWEQFATPQVDRESFESEAVGQIAAPATFDSGLGVATSGATVFMGVDYDGSPQNTFGLTNTTFFGENYLRFGLGSADGNYTVAFSTPEDTTAFAFNISGWQPEIAVVNGMGVTLRNDGALVSEFFINSDNYLTPVFYGFHDAAGFDEVEVDIYALPLGDPIVFRQDVIAFDDVAWATVPEPATLTVLLLGASAVVRRRR